MLLTDQRQGFRDTLETFLQSSGARLLVFLECDFPVVFTYL